MDKQKLLAYFIINSVQIIAGRSYTYKLPSLWIKLSDKIRGGDFKFRDYFCLGSALAREIFVVCETTKIEYLIDRAVLYESDVDLNKLWSVCPFRCL